MTEQFKKQLKDLINANSIDTLCDKPDYELAEMVCDFLSKLKSEGVVIGGEDHKNYIDMEIYLRDTEELRKQLDIRERAYNDLLGAYKKLEEQLGHQISLDGEPDLYEDC